MNNEIISSLTLGLYLLNTDMCWWRWWWGLWFCRKADYLRKGWDLICWNGLPLSWEVLLKGLPDRKYLGGGKEDHESTGGIFQQTEEGGWHDTDVLSWGLNYVSLEPHILECEVKWAIGSFSTNKASGGDGIPVELFQIIKDDAVKVLHSIYQHIWKTQQWPQDWKRSVFIPIPNKGNAKECSNYHTIAFISHDSKVILKILQARLQRYVNFELPDV